MNALIASYALLNYPFFPIQSRRRRTSMLTLLQFPSTRSSLTTLPVKKELPQRVRPNLWPLVVLAAMAVLVSVAPVHADTVPLSTLIANPSAEITGPGGLVYS